MGDNSRQVYGTGKKITDWKNYSPLRHKVVPFPEEYVCPLCESKADVVFPIALELCEKCKDKVIERTDIWWRTSRKKFDPQGFYCLNCGRHVPVIYLYNTRVCNRCTMRLGKNQKRYLNLTKYARKVV